MAAGGPTDAAADAANANAPAYSAPSCRSLRTAIRLAYHTMASGMSRQETVTAVIADV